MGAHRSFTLLPDVDMFNSIILRSVLPFVQLDGLLVGAAASAFLLGLTFVGEPNIWKLHLARLTMVDKEKSTRVWVCARDRSSASVAKQLAASSEAPMVAAPGKEKRDRAG